MDSNERADLENEWKALTEKHRGQQFIDPKEMRRVKEITSLLMTDGKNANINFSFVKGRNTTLGMNTKGYNKKGRVG